MTAFTQERCRALGHEAGAAAGDGGRRRFTCPLGGQLAAERAGEPAPAVVARRRARLVDESAHALRGERSHEPAPAGTGE